MEMPTSAQRDYAIDFTKGFLVVAMVAYHMLNYFVSGHHPLYAYVNYVTQAFIFYAGYMCGTIYFKKFTANKRYVYTRLIVRSFKLIILFLGLNLIIHASLKRNFNNQELGLVLFYTNIVSILINGNTHIARFAILLPLSYLLIIAAPMMSLFKLKYVIYISLIMFFCIVSYRNIELSYNLSCILTGIGGLLSGFISSDMAPLRNNTYMKWGGILILLFYMIVLIPLNINLRDYAIAYFFYINLIIINLNFYAIHLDPSKIINRIVIKYGQYSLMLYFMQIFILQALNRVLGFRLSALTIDHLLIFTFVNIALIFCCYLTDYLKNRYIIIDKSYRFIFQ